MNIVKNEKLIKRNGRIGQWTSLGGLAVLAGGMYISFQKPELFSYSLAALLLGFILTQVSMYFGNRFGRSPRPDEKLDAGLKGLPGEFVIYHYSTPVAHLMLGPAGIWILMPFHQKGQIVYSKNRWKMSGGGFLQNYLRVFGQEGLGRPDLDAEHHIAVLRKFLEKRLDGGIVPDIQAMMVFTNNEVELDSGESSLMALKLKQLKEFFRTQAREKKLGSLELERLTTVINNA
jgi:hypothetical protein